MATAPTDTPPHLRRSFGLLQATAFNMSNMVGIGIFMTVPFILNLLPGPQALLGWMAGALLALCDGMIWCELGAKWPGSGGSYLFLREVYGPQRWGRLLAFLFIWQFLLSGPLEIASGSIGFADYSKYLIRRLSGLGHAAIAMGVALAALILCYRRIEAVGKITVVLWIGMIATLGLTIAAGVAHFNARLAFHGEPWHWTGAGMAALGMAMAYVIYDLMGYYVVCYMGEEVREPQKTIPRSIIFSVIAVTLLYLAVHLAFVGVLPLATARSSQYVAAIFMEKVWGSKMAILLTLLILWTSFASVFALMLGYSRIPYAAAQDGYFFRAFQHVHPKGDFPDLSLLVLGAVTILASLMPLQTEITILLTSRILIQFLAQGFGIFLLHKKFPASERPFRMWLYPLPVILAMAGWLFVFTQAGSSTLHLLGRAITQTNMVWGAVSLVAGVPLFLIWSWKQRSWPFEQPAATASRP